MRLEALFRPRSIAVIGASEKPTVGRRMVALLDRIGFAGAIYPINPAYPTVLGHPCYPTIADMTFPRKSGHRVMRFSGLLALG
jgi:acetate---CoA ligase (ADP-forming)